MTTDEKLERLVGVVDALASSVVAHDNQIDALIKSAEDNKKRWEDLQREWQAYLRTLRPQ